SSGAGDVEPDRRARNGSSIIRRTGGTAAFPVRLPAQRRWDAPPAASADRGRPSQLFWRARADKTARSDAVMMFAGVPPPQPPPHLSAPAVPMVSTYATAMASAP